MADLTESRVIDTGSTSGRAVLPAPPAWWSYSSLKEVETCPLRYALSRADYPELWEQHGYPRLPNPAAIQGHVVHGALEIIVKALVRKGCSSTRSAEAVAVLRELGGYTKITEGVLATQMARFEGNPRLTSDQQDHLTRALTDWVPDAREQIQTCLNRLELRPSAPAGSCTSSDPVKRYPARTGEHPEKELRAEALRLRGRVDLLSIDARGVHITDFKTGAEESAHHEQLRLYVLLWAADSVVNPDGLAVTSLVASYPNREVAVPVPSAAELAQLRDEVLSRIAAADAVIHSAPAAALGEHCSLCNVRGLCDTYWTTGAIRTADVADGEWCDLAGVVVREHGVKSFVLREAHTGSEVLVRTPAQSVSLSLGSHVRILGAKRTVDSDEKEALIAALSSGSEVVELTVQSSPLVSGRTGQCDRK